MINENTNWYEHGSSRPILRFKKTNPDAVLPTASRDTALTGDSGYDLYAVEYREIEPGNSTVVPVGLQVAYCTPGYWFKIEARSGLGFKHSVAPHPGIIDNQYRGDMGVKVYNNGKEKFQVFTGDKIAQIVMYELIQPIVEWADEVDETDRGEKGFGSSDE